MEKTEPKIEAEWLTILGPEFEKPYFTELKSFLLEEKKLYRIYPPGNRIFAAFDYTPFSKVKVVVLGQDPYHGDGQAHGLCFSVPDGISLPPSLVNIYKELNTDLGVPVPKSGNLEKWAKQGVLLLNATLTVRANQAGSHQRRGWENFTDEVIRQLSARHSGLVFILWGSYAQAKEALIDTSKHFVLKAVHPSPLSVYRGFFGCRHFSKTNELLVQAGKEPVDWNLV
ncbi:MAG: uracil-DNA glycosylase [Bacteroidales bacterium]|nr:uracil-DNA glycosylase [Bacteroidales bacterium]